MKFIPVKDLNPAQLAFTKICLPKSIITVEQIIENKEFGSRSPAWWNEQLRKMREYNQEVQTLGESQP